ncbi:hypothetical protein AAFF_G00322060 [Aldrovandia affinis]|uniref:LRRN4 C-terminal-like protein n=1 Tax=Aldrovandia affinis TaxID=143900 RepID=A0AAD7SMA1_9TELE|nr:hypothetical protein AAFF_G00322060 [Aldrovandia affinis]
MAATGVLASSLLIILLLLLNGYLANPLTAPEGNYTSIKPPVTRMRILYVTDDEYTDYEEEYHKSTRNSQPLAPTRMSDPRPCDYDPCRDQQDPCTQLSALSGCLCPGVSGPRDRPEPPALGKVAQEGSGVVVAWCAPPSAVSSYRVVVDDGREPLVLGERLRRAVLEEVQVGATVCVEALNDAGPSHPSPHSCAQYELQADDGLSLRAGVIGGGLAFLLLLSLAALLFWKFNTCRKPRGDREGLGNPSYSSEGTL